MSKFVLIFILFVVVIYLYNVNKPNPTEIEQKKEIIKSMQEQFEKLRNGL